MNRLLLSILILSVYTNQTSC